MELTAPIVQPPNGETSVSASVDGTSPVTASSCHYIEVSFRFTAFEAVV